jgi:isopenicillin N synthase-like dioxygenase
VVSRATSFTSIPVVDISALRSTDAAGSVAVAAEIGKAAREVGFFYIAGAGVPEKLFERLLTVAKQFFALPLEEKMRIHVALSKNHRGYAPGGEESLVDEKPRLKEAFTCALDLPLDDPDHLAGNPLLGPNVWPDIPGFADTVTAYYHAVLDVGRLLLRSFAVALGEDPDYFTRNATKTPSQFGLLHYPYDPDYDDARPVVGPHSDYECVTLLRPTAPGLEVLNGAGEWIDAPPIPGTFIVNIGDMLELWTNGEFIATTHRVRNVSEDRYAFPVFFSVDYDTVIEPLPRLASRDGRTRRAMRAGEHLWAQTVQSFAYLRARLERGELHLPDGAVKYGSFGQGALQGASAPGPGGF